MFFDDVRLALFHTPNIRCYITVLFSLDVPDNELKILVLYIAIFECTNLDNIFTKQSSWFANVNSFCFILLSRLTLFLHQTCDRGKRY